MYRCFADIPQWIKLTNAIKKHITYTITQGSYWRLAFWNSITFHDLFHDFSKLSMTWIWPFYFARKELPRLIYFVQSTLFSMTLPSKYSTPTCMIFAGSSFRRVQLSRWTKLYHSPGTLLAKLCSTLVWSRIYWSIIGCQPNWTPSFWKDLVPLDLELYRAISGTWRYDYTNHTKTFKESETEVWEEHS